LSVAAPHLAALRARLKDAGTTPLAAALAFVLNHPEVDVGIVGVTAVSELEEILDAAAEAMPKLDWAACALNDPLVLTPSLW
jgi:aryl-alcohol dehydrogenase-like predicted oxidoreductase